MLTLFKRRTDSEPEQVEHHHHTAEPVRATIEDEQRLYDDKSPGFPQFLPWVEYLEDHKCFLLEDGRSVGAVFEIRPIGTEGREPEWLQTVRDQIEDALQDSFREIEDSPWVMQMFCQDVDTTDEYIGGLRQYIQSRDTSKEEHDKAYGTEFSERYIEVMNHHMRAIAKPGGLFIDKRVTKLPWQGKSRRVKLVVYRWIPDRERSSSLVVEPTDQLEQICERLIGALNGAGLITSRLDGEGFYNWLMPFFNPKPKGFARPSDFYRALPYRMGPDAGADAGLLELPFDHDFAEQLFNSEPVSDPEKGVWYFDGLPHRVMVVDRVRKPPIIGQVAGEIATGDGYNSLLDQLPDHTMMCITMIVTPQDILEERLNRLSKKAIGENLESEQVQDDINAAKDMMGSKHRLYQGAIAFYLRADSDKELNDNSVVLLNKLLGAGLQPVEPSEEVGACNSYLRWLPMAFKPHMDKKLWYSKLMFAQHITNLAPFWGRTVGTGNPGLTFFNRGGAPVTFDPLSRADRSMNAHCLIFGPTGSGKSASLVSIMIQLMAVYRPRLFVVEAGNSFGLTADFFKLMGLTVNKVSLKPGSPITLAPFADAKLLCEESVKVDLVEMDENEDDEDDERDILGELSITAKLMITGGELKEIEKLNRADESTIRSCILEAAETCMRENRDVLTEDVMAAFERRAEEEEGELRTRYRDMASAMRLFTQGFDGEMFNRPGTSWPEADVTIVDLATFAREGYEAQMAISYITLMNTVNNIAERDQYTGRDIVMITDEGHMITKNPLVAPYAVKITKMWRKLRAWYWLATQNLADFPGSAETMLNMIEWWICLNMPKQEIQEISRFKELTPAQEALLMSANKEPQKYTEGVVLSRNQDFMFRAVPPSLFLALAMTEGEEKRERQILMDEHKCSELEAAFYVSEKLDKARGIVPLPWKHLFGKDEDGNLLATPDEEGQLPETNEGLVTDELCATAN